MRAFVAALLVANLAFWGWSQGWLDALVGASPLGDREPARLLRQVQPERVRVVRAGSPPPATTDTSTRPADEAPAPASAVAAGSDPGCLEAGPFTPAQVVAAEAALVRAALPAGSWNDLRIDRPGVWIVYLGRFTTREQLALREAELRRQKIAFEPVRDAPDLEPGLALGRFDDRAAADAVLAVLQQRGVRNARVLTLAAPATIHLLRIDRADAALQAQLAALQAPALGSGFVRCGLAATALPGR